jgi:hypothetical protein
MSKEPDDSYLPTDGSRKRRKPFEIEDEPPRVPRLDDSKPFPRPPPLDLHGSVPVAEQYETPKASLSTAEDRIAHLERMQEILWKAIHSLEERLGVGKGNG